MRVTGLKVNLKNAMRLKQVATSVIPKEFSKSTKNIILDAKSRLVPFPTDTKEEANEIRSVRSSIGSQISMSNWNVRAEVFAGGSSKTRNMAAYLEFGTGDYAKNYLSGKPKWVARWASYYIVNRKGTLETHDYLYPAIDREFPELVNRIQNKVDTAWTI